MFNYLRQFPVIVAAGLVGLQAAPVAQTSRLADTVAETNLAAAAEARDWDTVRRLAASGADVNAVGGDGSLLDHSLLYLGSGMSNGNQHDRFTPPAVALGGANGRVQGNRHIAVADRVPAANFLLNLAEIAEVDVEQIGPSTGKLVNV